MVCRIIRVKKRSQVIQFIISFYLVSSLLFSSILILPQNFTILDTASAESTWIEITKQDFSAGTGENVVVTSDGNVELEVITNYIEDDFANDSKICFKNNVQVDTEAGEVKLVKINKTFGGGSSEHGYDAKQTSDGGYIITGCTASYSKGAYDLWLIKIDEFGSTEWTRAIGGFNNDLARSVEETDDGGYIAAGWTGSYGAVGNDLWLVKTNNLGIMQWYRLFGGDDHEDAMEVHQTSDGGYIIVGYTRSDSWGWSDLYLIKTDSSGTEEWSRRFGGNESDYGSSVYQTSDGGYIVGGYTSSYGAGGNDIWLIKTDASGNEVWNKTYGGDRSDYWGFVRPTSDGGFIVLGSTESYSNGYADVWLIKTDSSGKEQWSRTFGGSDHEFGSEVYRCINGDYIIIGDTRSFAADEGDIWLVKTDPTGAMIWNRSFDYGTYDVGYSTQQTSDGGFMLLGTESYADDDDNIWFLKTDSEGNWNPRGDLVSTNLLDGQKVKMVKNFNCTTSLPADTYMAVQFSKDNVTWYDSEGAKDSWDTLEDGFNSFDLSGLNWPGSGFYYSVYFISMDDALPALQNINVSYDQHYTVGIFTSQFYVSESTANWKIFSWSATISKDTELKFQIRTLWAEDELNDEDFVGPDGKTNSYYTTSGSKIWSGHDHSDGIQYRAYFSTTDPANTPTLKKVEIIYNYLPVVELTTPGTEKFGDIEITYTLFDFDDTPDTCSILVEYSTDYSTFYPATRGVGSDATSGLKASAAGVKHTFVWVSEKDLDGVDDESVYIRITPNDLDSGIPVTSSAFPLDNNDAPQILSITPTGNSGGIKINYKLCDNETDCCGINVEYQGGSVGSKWTEASLGELPVFEPGEEDRYFIWLSKADEPEQDAYNYQIKIIPCDNDTGCPVVTNSFHIDNKAPVIDSVSPVEGAKEVNIDSEISVIYNEPMLHSTTEAAFSMSPSVPGDFSWNYNILKFIPDSDLAHDETYTITIDSTATDILKNPLKDDYIWKFNTEVEPISNIDTDGDNTPDIYDADDDGDGFLDEWEDFLWTSSLDSNSHPEDTDGDGKPDGDKRNSKSWMDTDDDNDGLLDSEESSRGTDPLLADTDGDGYDDDVDAYPLDGSRWKVETGDKDNSWVILFVIIIIFIIAVIYIFIREKQRKRTAKLWKKWNSK